MPFTSFRKHKEAVSLKNAQETRQIQQHLFQLNNKIVESLNLHLSNFEEVSAYARNLKWEAIEDMATLLESFEENWRSNDNENNKIYWVNTAIEAEKIIEKIIAKRNPKNAITHAGAELTELEISNLLQKHKIKEIAANWEHELSNFIGEDKNHPLFPLIHKSEDYLNSILEDTQKSHKSPLKLWLAEHKANIIELNPKNTIAFLNAHFICPDLGAVVWSDNEGLHAQTLQSADTIVVLVGIDRVIQSSNHLSELSGMNNALSCGEYLSSNLVYLLGNLKEGQEVIVVLIDNSRSELLKNTTWRNLLADLDGTSWLNQCHDYPFLDIDNYHAYHIGPISALLSPLFYEADDFRSSQTFWADIQDGFLPHPLNLEFRKLLIHLRQEMYEANQAKTENIHSYWQEHEGTLKDTLGIKKWKLRRKIQEIIGKERKLPKMAKQTFMQTWQEQIHLAKKQGK